MMTAQWLGGDDRGDERVSKEVWLGGGWRSFGLEVREKRGEWEEGGLMEGALEVMVVTFG